LNLTNEPAEEPTSDVFIVAGLPPDRDGMSDIPGPNESGADAFLQETHH